MEKCSDIINLLVFITLLICINSSAHPITSNAASSSPPPSSQILRTYTNFVKTKCAASTYPVPCLKTLYPYASFVKTNSQRLCLAALNVAIQNSRSASKTVSTIAARKGLTARDKAALKDCSGNIKDAISELQDTVTALGRLSNRRDRAFQWSNAKTYASAASSDFESCRDGFTVRGVTPAVRQKIRSDLLYLEKLVSTALFLINHLY